MTQRAMKTAEVRTLRDTQWNMGSSLMKDEENAKIVSSIVAQLAVHPKVAEVAAQLKWGPVQKRKYLLEVVRSRFNNLKRKAEDEIKPVAVQALIRLRNNASSRKSYVSKLIQIENVSSIDTNFDVKGSSQEKSGLLKEC